MFWWQKTVHLRGGQGILESYPKRRGNRRLHFPGHFQLPCAQRAMVAAVPPPELMMDQSMQFCRR